MKPLENIAEKPIKTDYLSTNFSVTIQSIDFSKINRSKIDEYIELMMNIK